MKGFVRNETTKGRVWICWSAEWLPLGDWRNIWRNFSVGGYWGGTNWSWLTPGAGGAWTYFGDRSPTICLEGAEPAFSRMVRGGRCCRWDNVEAPKNRRSFLFIDSGS